MRLLGDGNITATLGSRPEVEFVLAIDSDGVRDFQNNIPDFLSFSFTDHNMMETALSLPQVDPNNFQRYKTVLPSVETSTEGVYTLTYAGMDSYLPKSTDILHVLCFTDFQHGTASASVTVQLDGTNFYSQCQFEW